MSDKQPIAYKTGRILRLLLLFFALLGLRCLMLAGPESEKWRAFASKPGARTLIEAPLRGSIYDRFGITLAGSKIQYNAAIYYAPIKQIDRLGWREGVNGKKERAYPRSDYIAALSAMLSEHLNMDARSIEDQIHGRAAIFPHTPYVIKRDIDEKLYYKLRLMQRDFPGLSMEKSTRRVYPLGKVAADVIGYLGVISDREYRRIADEKSELSHYIRQREEGNLPFLPVGYDSAQQVSARLAEIKEKTYTISEMVGKSGVEAKFDSLLHGYSGKKNYEVDPDGNLLKELPGARAKVDGQDLLLSISAELQEYAEQLLAESEKNRGGGSAPWICGGAIVAMLPESGEVLCLASHPRFNPSDFLSAAGKREKVAQWLENEHYLEGVWDGSQQLVKETFNRKSGQFEDLSQPLSWDYYLSEILSKKSAIYQAISKVKTVKNASDVVRNGDEKLQELIAHPRDRFLMVDLCDLALNGTRFSADILEKIGSVTLSSYREQTQCRVQMTKCVKELTRHLFKERDFADWRAAHFKSFLKEKRKEEMQQRRYHKPYIDYLEQLEGEQFAAFWADAGESLLQAFILGNSDHLDSAYLPYYAELIRARQSFKGVKGFDALTALGRQLGGAEMAEYIGSMRPFKQLTLPLRATYHNVRRVGELSVQKDLAAAFYPLHGYGFGRSQAFRQSTPSGSLFKLVVAYQAMMEKYLAGPYGAVNPLTITDESFTTSTKTRQVLGQMSSGENIYRLHKGGILPRGSHSGIGKIDIAGAIESSSNIYFSLLAGDFLSSPESLCEASRKFSYGRPTGIALPGEIGGTIPSDLAYNKTGLYAFAIGQHSLVVTPLQSAVMINSLATGGEVLTPRIVKEVRGSSLLRQQSALFQMSDYPFKEELLGLGVDFPLFTQSLMPLQKSGVPSGKEVARKLPMPREVKAALFEGMWKAVNGAKGTARASLLSLAAPESRGFVKDYIEIQQELIGKTGTAEILYKKTLDGETPASMEKHVWFGGFSTKKPVKAGHFDSVEPEIVVVVYLRFGKAGKEAAPLAAQIVKKWREIKAKHELKGSSG